jgi:DNA-binding NarL/FixJ family response regulator
MRVSIETPKKPLSPQEQQVLKLSAQGNLDKEIADELGISQNTVDTYWRRIYKKTGKHDRKILFAQSDSLSVT